MLSSGPAENCGGERKTGLSNGAGTLRGRSLRRGDPARPDRSTGFPHTEDKAHASPAHQPQQDERTPSVESPPSPAARALMSRGRVPALTTDTARSSPSHMPSRAMACRACDQELTDEVQVSLATEFSLSKAKLVKSLSHVWLFGTPWTLQSLEFSRPEYERGSLSLLHRIFPTQGSNPGLPPCRWILYQLSHKGSPKLT